MLKYSILLSFILTSVVCAAQQLPSSYVNPFIGTSNYGTTQPGPIVPQGAASMSVLNTIGVDGNSIRMDRGWCSTPYVWDNKHMAGFTNVNLSGVGCPDFGSLILMPTTGEKEVDFKKYHSTISDQKASVGYYSTYIDRYKIMAEMTATERTTLSRYTFPEGKSNILFNLGLGLTNESGAAVKIVSDREIEGYKIMGTFCYTESQSIIPVYFVVRVSQPMQVNYWKKQQQLEGTRSQWDSYSGKYKIYSRYTREMAGNDIGVVFSFESTKQQQVEVGVGISYTSIENARENLNTEQNNASFETIKANAFDKWNAILSNINVEGGSNDQNSIFYTALYHTLIHPNILQDVNGEYPAMVSGKTMRSRASDRLTMFSLWDTYRINPALMSLLDPQRQRTAVQSLMMMYRESGNLPKYEIGSEEFHVMQGDPAIPYIVDSYFKGLLKGMNIEEIYDAMIKNAYTKGSENRVRPDLDFYANNYYLPLTKDFDNSVSQALEYYIADWALAQMAKDLGHTDDYTLLMKRAMGYKKYFDPAYSLLRPLLSSGEFMPGFDPRQGENFAPVHGFHEGTSYNYSFYIPHDIKGLIKLHGGAKKFTENLDAVFTKGLFDMSNEPDMGYPFYFSYVKGSEWRTQFYVDQLLEKYFKNTPGGLPGNDDTGTMSAWCAFAMMGLYQAVPSSDQYVVFVPKFKKITIKL
ncbi:MAG: GH92 family glycosyl hydrolase, partial [Rikenellaceae bacterium]